ncbi:MAG: DsbC family protein [Ferrovum sp.]|nr:DsbC family protein [Ferrovum sp.]
MMVKFSEEIYMRALRKLMVGMMLFGVWAVMAAPVTQSVEDLLIKKLPRLEGHVTSFLPAEVPGWYEIYTDDRQLLYVDEKINFIFSGDIISVNGLRNLSQARLEQLGSVPLTTLPLNLAMKEVRGNGSRRLVVFSDPDCPYCRKLEHELQAITNVTIYTFLYPLTSLHPEADKIAQDIACSANPLQSWQQYMLHDQKPKTMTCQNHLNEIQALGNKYQVTGTPTLIYGNGRLIPGVPPADVLDKNLTQFNS